VADAVIETENILANFKIAAFNARLELFVSSAGIGGAFKRHDLVWSQLWQERLRGGAWLPLVYTVQGCIPDEAVAKWCLNFLCAPSISHT
jgi:hypothetical protein